MKKTGPELILLYLLLIAGGVWHLLGWFQDLMRLTAGPLLIALAVFLFVTFLSVQAQKPRAVLWGLLVFAGGFLFEAVGVKTGLIFGDYTYGSVLQPQITGVPLAIGFAWLGIQISSLAVAQRLLPRRSPYLIALATALLMVAFDVFMEPAAIYLNYWTWSGGHPPLHNYLGWFGIALLFSLLGARLQLYEKRLPIFALHAYAAQLIYFVLINIKTL